MISDGRGGFAGAQVLINVTAAANQLPSAVNDAASGNEDTTITGNVLTNDSDPDVGDTLTAVSLTQPVVVVSGNPTTTPAGSVTMLANGDFSYVPAANFNGTAQFTYRLLDGREELLLVLLSLPQLQ